ncbi:hypothetical protein F2Q68_00021121 [Brassica cretica]|uniref:Uncharacterized protein n=1 Tax=Brassica cretica TaxID=69181 RepID=A0A8S9FR16_BRACR|nr:hypothetical protein F2Q68_00021121 [Brassica cretica]
MILLASFVALVGGVGRNQRPDQVTLGGGAASSVLSNVRIATVISKRIFPSGREDCVSEFVLLECSVGVGIQCRFHPIRCSLSFGGSCPAARVIVNILPCSVQIERLGSLEYRTHQRFGDSTYSLMDRGIGIFDFFLERSRLDALRAPSQLVPVDRQRTVCPQDGSRPELRLVLGSMSCQSEGINLDLKSQSEGFVAPGLMWSHRWLLLVQMVLFLLHPKSGITLAGCWISSEKANDTSGTDMD